MTWTLRLIAVASLAFVGNSARADDDDKKPHDDADFAKHVASCDMAEIDLSKLVADRSRNEDVKKYAKKMADDHNKNLEDLRTVTKSAGITIPDKMNEEHQKVYDKFNDYKGENFDRDFIKQMVEDHEKAVKAFTRATKEAKNQELKDFATKHLPTIQSHLDEAKKLQDQIK